MNDILKEEIKEFFNDETLQVHVLHEYDKDNLNIEHFFVLYRLDQIKNKKIVEHFKKFSQNVQNFTNVTKNFLTEQKDSLIYLPVISLDKKDPFYLQQENYVKGNYNNILSLNTIGEVADIQKHLQFKIQNQFSIAKNIGLSVGLTTKEMLDEQLPIAKNKIKNLIKKFK